MQILQKRRFSLTAEHRIKGGLFPQQLLAVVADLRASSKDGDIGTDAAVFLRKVEHHLDIPDIAGQQQNIRLLSIDFVQNIGQMLVDGVLGNLAVVASLGGKLVQIALRKIRGDLFAI